jgi:hypothetical protein
MDIILHNPPFIQAGVYQYSDQFGQIGGQSANQTLTSNQRQAYKLFNAGFNVFPLPYGSKAGYPWKALQYTRLNPVDREYGLLPLTAGTTNLGILCGATSGNLFVLDCESHPTLMRHMTELRNREIPLWVVMTGRGGHIYFRCREGEVESIEPGVMDDAELRGRNGYVLAPGSRHPSGKMYQWLVKEGTQPPLVSVKQIDWLRAQSGAALQLRYTPNRLNSQPTWTRQMVSPYSHLAKTTKDYLANGHTLPEGSRNNRLFRAACDMAGNQYTQSEVESLLIPIALLSGLAQHESLLTIASAFSRTRTPARPGEIPAKSTYQPHPAWRHALLYGSHRSWLGRSSSNHRALFLALIERARLAANERGIFRASVRELAELARMAVNTVRRILDAFLSESLICKAGTDKLSTASLWRFSDVVLREGIRLEATQASSVPDHWRSYAESLFYCDATERGAIGKTAMFLYRFMTTRRLPMLPTLLAAESGLTVNQVNYALYKLSEAGLIHRIKQGWIADLVSDEELAQQSPKQGKGEWRRRKHQRERELFMGRVLLGARMRAEGKAFIEALVAYNSALSEKYMPRRGIPEDPFAVH